MASLSSLKSSSFNTLETAASSSSTNWSFAGFTERLFESFTTCGCGDSSATFDEDDEDQLTMTSSPSLLSAQRWSGLELETSTMGYSYSHSHSHSRAGADDSTYDDNSAIERRSCGSPKTKPSNLPMLRQLPSFSTQGSRTRSEYSYVSTVNDETATYDESASFYPIQEKDSEEELVEVSLSSSFHQQQQQQQQQGRRVINKPVPIKPSSSAFRQHQPTQQFQFLDQ